MRAFFFIPVAKLRNSSVQEFSVTGEEIFFPRQKLFFLTTNFELQKKILLESLKLGLEIERSRVLYRGEIYWHLICELSRGFFSCQTGSTEKDRQTETEIGFFFWRFSSCSWKLGRFRSSLMGRDVKKEEMEEEGIERMIERLCQLPDLYLPHSLAQRSEPMSQGEKQSHLRSLVRRDAAIFLGTKKRRRKTQSFLYPIFCIQFLLSN